MALVARSCGGCGRPLGGRAPAAGEAWCLICRERWGPLAGWWEPAAGGVPGWAASPYRGPVRRAVLLAKRGRALALCELLMWRLPAEPPLAAATVTWVPGHPRRVMAAPDAGNALARAVARHYDLPLAQLLTRSVWGRRQAGHSAEVRRERSEQLRLSVRGAVPDRVLVVDDVRTTGATLDRVGTLLRAAGARQVEAIVVASARLPSA